MKYFFLLLLFINGSLTGQTGSIFEQMIQDSALDVYLRLDWRMLEKKKMEKMYQPAHLFVRKYNGDTLSAELKVKSRGNMRLTICSYPPVKLKFDKSALAKMSYSAMNELDLVQACHDGDSYDQYLLREYLAYQIYRLITPYSFRTQLVRIHYINEDFSEAHKASYGILVENEEELVARLGGKKCKTQMVSKNAIERESFLTASLFQFMIGNTDWYIPTRHNLDFMIIPGHNLLVTVPYDFDYSGLVAAPYATHHETIKLASVSARYYQGWCETEEDVKSALKVFLEKKDEILALPKKIPGLSEKSVKYTTTYLEEFYNIIENPKKLENHIVRHCNMWPVPE